MALLRVSLDTRQPFLSNSKGNLVFRVVVESADTDVAWPLTKLVGKWFYLLAAVPKGGGSVELESFAEFERQLLEQGG